MLFLSDFVFPEVLMDSSFSCFKKKHAFSIIPLESSCFFLLNRNCFLLKVSLLTPDFLFKFGLIVFWACHITTIQVFLHTYSTWVSPTKDPRLLNSSFLECFSAVHPQVTFFRKCTASELIVHLSICLYLASYLINNLASCEILHSKQPFSEL